MLTQSISLTNIQHAFIQKDIPLKDKNWFGTGGAAKFYCEPQSFDQFAYALEFAKTNNLEIFVLGDGANILIGDEGFDGLVIRPQLKDVKIALPVILGEPESGIEGYVTAGAGVRFEDLIVECNKNHLIGLEEFSGIPGTVGGSVYINIHYFEFLLSHFLTQATVINKFTEKIEIVDNAWFNFGYDQSKLLEGEYYLLDATFKLKFSPEESAFHRGRSVEIIRHRKQRYPYKGTCGSFFRNFHQNEVTLESGGKKMIYTAYYLDKLGVKGQLRVGDAIVSYQHANMLVNLGNATSTDIINLACEMQELVKENFGILPQPECQFIGFKEYPLLK